MLFNINMFWKESLVKNEMYYPRNDLTKPQ